jgi:hypothetical protein
MVLRNQRGQFVIESILLMVVLISVMSFAMKTLREQKFLGRLVETPWDYTAGMIESGTWTPPATAKQKIPYQYKRFYTPDSR